MFDLYYGNDADALAGQLAALLRTPGARTPIVPEVVLVPQFGMRRWLEIQLAESDGIIANVDFFAPAEYAWRLLRAARPGLVERALFDRAVLRWRLLPLLDGLARESRYAALADALGNSDARRTCFMLAGDLAKAFERYLAYRRDLLEAWERGEEPDDWQAELWRRVVRSTDQPHRARLITDYIRRWDGSAQAPPGLPARLFAFGCTDVSPDVLRFFGVVAQHCELAFLMPNPCREYWGDVRSERELLRTQGADAWSDGDNPLLAGFGRSGRDFIAQLFSYEQVQPNLEQDLARTPGRASLLHSIQSDILELAAPRPAKPALALPDPDDASLQFHICHSRLREVQVLHDQLLALFARCADLEPRQVAVMAPDISAYAPYVDAVFAAPAPEDARRLPYSVSDHAARAGHPLIMLTLALARLPLSRRGVGEVFELLAIPAVMRKFGFDAGQLALLERWLRAAGVRWGADETQRAAFGAGRYREYSWAFGLERLLFGYASGDSAALIAGIAPYAAVEGAATQTLDALLRALDVLETLAAAQRGMHTAQRWQQIYNAALDALIDAELQDRDERRALEQARSALAALAEDAAAAGMNATLDWQCVHVFLAEQLARPEPDFRYLTGGINFCAMVPLRTVPFRVICLLGMNDDAFPRRDQASGLNRMHAEFLAHGRRRPGDRSERDEDRYLFLQLLTASRDVLYLSWIGEDPRGGIQREPSPVVAELLDVVARGYFVDAAQTLAALVTRHPLQPFSARLFTGAEPRVFTFRDAWRAAATGGAGAAPVPKFANARLAMPVIACIDRAQLQHFWRNPARAFLTEALGMHVPRREDAATDDDPVELDALERHQLLEALVDAQLSEDRGEDTLAAWRARALLPVGHAGAAALAQVRIPAAILTQALRERRTVPADLPQPFELTLADGSVLTGMAPEHFAGLVCRWSAGAANARQQLQAWLDYLILAAQRADARLVEFAWDRDRKILVTTELAGLAPAAARTHLQQMVEIYQCGLREPLLFFPQAARAYAQRWRKLADAAGDARHAQALAAAERAFASSSRHTGEDLDPAFALATRGLAPFDAGAASGHEFARLALAVFEPLLRAIEESA